MSLGYRKTKQKFSLISKLVNRWHLYLELCFVYIFILAECTTGLSKKHTISWLISMCHLVVKFWTNSLTYLSGGVHNENWGHPTPTRRSLISILTVCTGDPFLPSRYRNFFFNLMKIHCGNHQKMTIKTAAISQNGEFITRSMSWTTGSFRKMNNKMPAVKSPAIVNPRPT